VGKSRVKPVDRLVAEGVRQRQVEEDRVEASRRQEGDRLLEPRDVLQPRG